MGAAALVVEVPVEAAERAVVGTLALEEQLALFGAKIAQVSMQTTVETMQIF